jgi:hypothetical protein
MMAESWESAAIEGVSFKAAGKKHVSVATEADATTAELLEVVFSMWSMPRLCSKDEWAS